MSRFYLVLSKKDESKTSKQSRLFQAACLQLGVEFFEINAEKTKLGALPILQQGDMLYRNSATKRAKTVEKILVNPEVVTFYKNYNSIFLGRKTSYFQNIKMGLPVMPSYPFLPRDREELSESIDYLGGFPLIVKVMGNSKGIGIIKVDSTESYKSLVDYLVSVDAATLIRKFIPHTHYGRFIVIGEKVIASNRTKVPIGEFRSNTSENTDANRELFDFGPEINQIAIDAVSTNGLEFGGVDIRFDSETGLTYIAEDNFPCQFEYAQRITGVDIALEMVSFLAHKQRTL